MSNVGLTLSPEEHQRAVMLAISLQAIVMGDGIQPLKLNAKSRADFIKSMDELISLLRMRDAFGAAEDAEAEGEVS